MDKSHQLYFFLFSTTLFTDIIPTGDFTHSWFDAQKYCLGQGLTIDRDKSDQPYWTGVYRRLTPWIKTLGCYPDSIESLSEVVEMTMTISSVQMCQEICHHENIHRFAVKMNKCLCIDHDIFLSHHNQLSAFNCNFKCGGSSDNIYLDDCGGENAYNIYGTQRVDLNSDELCLSLQCSLGDIRFVPQKCSIVIEKVCENMTLPDSGFATNWTLAMKQCKTSKPSSYLWGDFDLNNPRQTCERIPHNLKLVWIGVARQTYTRIDQDEERNWVDWLTLLTQFDRSVH
uniref:WSC domain-containing protein n=1 Tax=Magallana gigas TaxID=29159 RepID=A0A8W8NWV7_MAGGI